MIVFDEDFTLLHLAEVAEELGISLSKVQKFVRAGSLAAVHHGGRWMVALDELQRFRKVWAPQPRRSRLGVPRQFRPADRPKVG